MGGAFQLPNLTVGGGSAFSALLAQLLGELGQQRNVRAGLASDLFGQLLNRGMEANRRGGLGLVDQLLLGGEVGSVLPLSQGSQEQLGRYTSRPEGNLLQDLQRRLDLFSVGMLTPTQQVAAGFNPSTGVELTPSESEYIRLAGMSPQQRTRDAVAHGVNPQTGAPLTDPERRYISALPQGFQYGGSAVIDPKRLRSTGGYWAGPATITDVSGKKVGRIGEGRRPEQVNITPMPVGIGTGPISVQGSAKTPPASATPGATDELASLPLDVQYRLEAITQARPDLPMDVRLNIARSPGGFEAYSGIQTDPRAAGARLLGGALQGDRRFSGSLVRSLALGRPPSPADLNAADFSRLPPDLQESLLSVVGPDLARQWLFELSGFTPRGTRTRIAQPIAA